MRLPIEANASRIDVFLSARTPGTPELSLELGALFVRAARVLSNHKADEIAARCGVSRRAIYDVAPRMDEQVRAVERVLGDPRFAGLPGGDLRRDRSWTRYARG